ncbi:MAG: hypothetical protein HYS20_01545 [Rhodocyclales bacterium]|nr:hypothetical protein [Rhodocyclales bacterium]
MPAARGQIIRVAQGEDPGADQGHRQADDARERLSPVYAYYFLMARVKGTGGMKRRDQSAMSAFGPFAHPHAARFISASARFLGLLDEAEAPVRRCSRRSERATAARLESGFRRTPRIPEPRLPASIATYLSVRCGWPFQAG